MLRRTIGVLGATTLTMSLFGGIALAGQPGAECGDDGATLNPPGFDSTGFANAETHYAGSEGTKSLLHSNSDKAVSQYDIACVHYTAAHR